MFTKELSSCPKCGSRKVRTGRIYLLHLARLTAGSRRRYCPVCRIRWTSSLNAFSPWFRLAFILPAFAAVVLAFACMTYEICFSPTPSPDLVANAQKVPTQDAEALALMEGGAEGAYGQSLSARFGGEGFTYENWRVAQAMAHNPEASMRLMGVRGQNGRSQDVMDFLQQITAMGKTPQQIANEIDTTDKQTLWDKYGSKFSSKAEAEAAYNKFQSNRSEILR